MTDEQFDKEVEKRFGAEFKKGNHVEIHKNKNGITYFSVKKSILRRTPTEETTNK